MPRPVVCQRDRLGGVPSSAGGRRPLPLQDEDDAGKRRPPPTAPVRLLLALAALLVAGALYALTAERTADLGSDVTAEATVEAVGGLQLPAEASAGGPFGVCPRPGVYCLDVWDPVICSNGQVYSNDCYAYRACATGCVPLNF